MIWRSLLAKIFSFGRYPEFVRSLWWRHAIPALVRRRGVKVGRNVRFLGMPIISLMHESTIEIGEGSVICSNSSMTALGVNHPVVLRTLRPGASIVIGNNTGISGGTICAATSVKIGNECMLGANVTITDTDFHTINPIDRRHNTNPLEIAVEAVTIEDNVFIGTGTIILKGVRLGRNSVIGAGSVVTKDFPPDSIAAGNPARLLKRL